MRIKLVYENHWNFGIHVADTLRMLAFALRHAGYAADIEKRIVPGALNILLDNFDRECLTGMREAHALGARFVIVATEFLTGKTFNDFGLAYADAHYGNRDYWFSRYEHFREAVSLADSLWHLSDHQAPVFAEAFERDVHYLPHCFSPGLGTVSHRAASAKDIDIVFTGTLTPFREKLFQSMQRLGLKVEVVPMLTAAFHRDDLLARSRLAINLTQHLDWPHTSVSRLFYHLVNDSPILSMQVPVASPLDPYVFRAEASTIVEVARSLATADDLAARFRARASRLASEQDAAHLMPALIKKSLGHLELENLTQ